MDRGGGLEPHRLADLGLTHDLDVAGVFVKSPVFPFVRFPGVDSILGPEMKSTGEVMGGSTSFGVAFAKAQLSVGQRLPERTRQAGVLRHRIDRIVRDGDRLRFVERIVVFDSEMIPNSLVYPA